VENDDLHVVAQFGHQLQQLGLTDATELPARDAGDLGLIDTQQLGCALLGQLNLRPAQPADAASVISPALSGLAGPGRQPAYRSNPSGAVTRASLCAP
jgi:hypothetical protein